MRNTCDCSYTLTNLGSGSRRKVGELEIVEVTAFVAAIGALVAATAGLIREIRLWIAAQKKAGIDDS